MESRIPTVGGQNVAGHLAAASARTHWSGQINGCKRDLFAFFRLGFSLVCVIVLANPTIDSQILIGNRRIYVDNRLHTLLDIKFNEPFFERGQFPEVIFDGSNPVALQNPWINGTNATPFDQGKFPFINGSVEPTLMPRFDLLFNRMFLRLLLDHERCSWWYQWLVS